MTIPLWCLFVVMLLPYGASVFGAVARVKHPEGLNNKYPRTQAASLTGFGARAYAAQANAWEAVAVFTVGVVIHHLATDGAISQGANTAAIVFVLMRLGHLWAYLSNKDILRGAFFLAGGICSIALVIIAATAP